MYIHLHGLAQPQGPLPQPVIPGQPPVPMPTNPLVPKSGALNLSRFKATLVFHTNRKRLPSRGLQQDI